MKKILVVLLILGLFLGLSTAAFAAYTETIEASTGYFVPTDEEKYDSPYYRWYGEDWGWEHSAYAPTISSAILGISAFDVDNYGGNYDEYDAIFVKDNGVWTSVGFLDGASDIWSYTSFTLTSNFFDDIANGLEVKIAIDTLDAGWAVTLAKSTLLIDGGQLPNPNPGSTVPEPATMALFGLGLLGLAGVSRKK